MNLTGECITLHLETKPMSCPRPRVAGGRAYMPMNYVQWKSGAVTQIRNQIAALNIEDVVFVDISFVYQRPQSLMRKSDPTDRIFKGTKPDLDNITKSVLDALQDAKVIKDDAQVVGIIATKWYGKIRENKKSERNHIKIDIYPLKG